jgi:hypothetical protein
MTTMSACNCIGPQYGQPLCPCMMRGLVEIDGQWVRPATVIGPVRPKPQIWARCDCATAPIIGLDQKYCHKCGKQLKEPGQ